MATAGGPDIERDGLVFGYDTGYGIADNDTSTRFYPGEPTTNHSPTSFGDWGTESTAERIATGNTFRGQPTYNCRTVVGQSWRGIEKTITGLRTAAGASGTVTMSCMVRNNNSSAYSMYAYIGHDFGSTRTIAANSDWQRIQWTVNQSSMNNDYVEFRPYTNNASIYLEMTMPQVEVNVGTATPWTETSRSSTTSLIDLKKTTDIDVSNVSFDSTGQPTFDGTDDRIGVTHNVALDIPTNITVEAVVKYSAQGGGGESYGVITYKGYPWNWLLEDQGGKFNFRISTSSVSDSNINSNFSHGLNTYHHVVATYNGTTQAIYVNGVLKASKSLTGTITTTGSTVRVGSYTNGDYVHNGDIPVVKIYNRAFTAQEIKQNYNAYKNRFNI